MNTSIRRNPNPMSKTWPVVLVLLAIFFNIAAFHGYHEEARSQAPDPTPDPAALAAGATPKLFLPVVFRAKPALHVINVPYFSPAIKTSETAVVWFGKVTQSDNSADVRLGYTADSLWVRVSSIDRRLWYDPAAKLADLAKWDSVSLYLDLSNVGNSLDSGHAYRFDAELNWWEARDAFQAAYQGVGSGWSSASLAFTTRTQWWGFPEPNDDKDDRAWKVEFTIPFQNLGLSSAPPQNAKWRLAVQVHDRDNAQGSPPIPDQTWPATMNATQPETWQQISFGLPGYATPSAKNTKKLTLRNGLNGVSVVDGVVGGNTDCGTGLSFWTDWGNHAYPGIRDLNVQNQGNTDDWPCFSRLYITFPLSGVPANKVIVSATLTMHQSGQSSGFASDPPDAVNSLIQIYQLDQGWNEATLTWNNAPLAVENVSQAWVGQITMADLGAARTWDVSRAVANAYKSGSPLYLALYSADAYGPHGKYFFSSDSTDYDGAFRPQLDIVYGDP